MPGGRPPKPFTALRESSDPSHPISIVSMHVFEKDVGRLDLHSA